MCQRTSNKEKKARPLKLSASLILIALIDTGISLANLTDFQRSRINQPLSHDLTHDQKQASQPFEDSEGHGTQLARVILDSCSNCRIASIKIAKPKKARSDSFQPNADTIANAIDRALKIKAEVIILSAGSLKGSKRLEAASKAVAKSTSLFFTAAGNGIENPFKPIAVSTLFPQRYSHSFIVGNLDKTGQKPSLLNFGPEIRLWLKDETGSSQACARAAALTAQYWSLHREATKTVIESQLAKTPEIISPELRSNPMP